MFRNKGLANLVTCVKNLPDIENTVYTLAYKDFRSI